MVTILYSRLKDNLPVEQYEAYLLQLPPAMRDQNRKYLRWQDRLLNLFGKLLLLEVFRVWKLAPDSINQLLHNEYGRPYLAGAGDFNISHSGEYVVCAFSQQQQLGIDIEKVAPVAFADFENVMSPVEWQRIRAATDPLAAFFRYWAIKESVIKADSRGLSIPLQSILIDEQVAACTGKLWYLLELEIDPGYAACLAVDQPVEKPVYRQVSF